MAVALLSSCGTKGVGEETRGESEGLRCSIGLGRTAIRVGDRVVANVKIENALDQSTYIYFPPIYQAELLEVKNDRGEIVTGFQTAVYGPPSIETIKKCFHRLEPGDAFNSSISGRVALDFVPASASQQEKANRAVLLKFGDYAHRVQRPGKFMVRLRFSMDARSVHRGTRYGFTPVWRGTAFSNSVPFTVRLMTREELDDWIGVLRESEGEQKAEAIEGLKANADGAAVPVFVNVVSHGPDRLTRPALDALGTIQDSSVVPKLMAIYAQTHRGDFQQMLLGAIRSLTPDVEETARLLVKVLESNASVEAKSYAVYALGDLRRPESVPAMVKAAKSGNPRIQRAAIDALGTILEFGRTELPPSVKASIIDELVGIMRKDPDRTVRSRSASALGRSGDALVVPALAEALDDENLWVGSYAAHSLGKLGGVEVIPALKDYARRAERESQVDAAEQAIKMIRSRAKQE